MGGLLVWLGWVGGQMAGGLVAWVIDCGSPAWPGSEVPKHLEPFKGHTQMSVTNVHNYSLLFCFGYSSSTSTWLLLWASNSTTTWYVTSTCP